MKRFRKFLSLFFVLLMLISVVPSMPVYAATGPSAPSISSTTNDTSFKVSWKKVKGATGYRIYYSKSSKFSSYKTIDTTKTTYTVTGLKAYTKYYVKVKAYKKSGKKRVYSKYSNTKNFVLHVRETNLVSLQPQQAAFVATAKAVTKVSGYQFYYATKSDFSDKKIVTTSSTTILPKQLGGSNGVATKYYVKVRTYAKYNGKTYYSNFSAVKSVTTLKVPTPKDAMVLSCSAKTNNGSYGFALKMFNYDDNTTGYQVRVCKNNTFRSNVITSKTLPSSAVSMYNLSADTIYYYQVRSVYNLDGKEYFGKWVEPEDNAFKTNCSYSSLSPKITNVSLTNQNKTCDVSWNALSTSYDSIKYVVQYSTVSSFNMEDGITVQNETSETNYHFSVNYDNRYYVRVKALITIDNKTYDTNWSNVNSLEVKNPNAIYSTPEISATSAKKNTITLSWNNISNATGYEVLYANNSSFNNSTLLTTGNTSITISGLTSGTVYYVKVRATNDAGYKSGYSKVKTITTTSENINQGIDIQHAGYSNNYVATEPFLYGYQLYIDYHEDRKAANDYVNRLKKAYSEMGITFTMNDIDKYLAIGKWMSGNISYDNDLVLRDCYDALKTGKCVCEGYSELLNDFCYLAEIPCFYVTGDNHAYNMVKIQGYWYRADPTSRDGFTSCSYVHQSVSVYSDSFKKTFNDADSVKSLGFGLGFPSTMKSGYDILKSNNICCPMGDLNTLKSLDSKIYSSFYKIVEVKTVCRKQSSVDRFNVQEISYSFVDASSSNWVS